MEIVDRDGVFWPADDDWCYRVIHDELSDVDAAVARTKDRKIAVQAGGNVGVWAAHLAKHFDQVVTVEPDAVNYRCLQLNVPANVVHMLAGLGATPGAMGLINVAGNAGAHYASADGDIPVVTVDSLDLDACDLLCLDIEGQEPHALAGAEQTIRHFRPVIMFEEKGLSERYYGVPRGTAEAWVVGLGLGYRLVERRRMDFIFACH